MNVPVDSILSFNADYLTDIGKVLVGADNKSVNVPNNTYTTLASLTLPAGTYILVGNHQWSGSVDSTYVDVIGKASGASLSIGRASAAGGGGMLSAAVIDIETQTTVIYETYQGTGATRTANAITFKAIKIA